MIRTLLLALLLASVPAAADAQPTRTGSDAAATAKNEATVLIPPQGGTADIPVRFSTNLMLSFPSVLGPHAIQSSPDWDVKAYAGASEIYVRPTTTGAKPTTLALGTKDGVIKVNISLRVVPEEGAEGLTLVRFVSSTAEEAFRAAVAAEVTKVRAIADAEIAAVRQEQAESKRAMDATVRATADALVARRLLSRHETRRLAAHERNGDNVIVHGDRVVLLGEDAYVVVRIENRSSAAYRLAGVKLTDPSGTDRAGPAVLRSSSTTAPEAGLIGVIPAGTSGTVAIVVRQVDAILGKPLRLDVEEPAGRGRVTITRGITIR